MVADVRGEDEVILGSREPLIQCEHQSNSKEGNLDTHTHTHKCHMEIGILLPQAKELHQKLETWNKSLSSTFGGNMALLTP